MSDSKSTEIYEKIADQVVLAHEKNVNLDKYQRMAGMTSQVIKSTDAIMQLFEHELRTAKIEFLKELIANDLIVYWNDDRDLDGHIFISDLEKLKATLNNQNTRGGE